MGKNQYIQGSDGKFKGSKPGQGKTNIPSASDINNFPAPAVQTSLPPKNYTDVHTSFTTLLSDHAWVLQQTVTKQIEIVSDPETSPKLLQFLANDSRTSPEVLVEIAKQENTSPETYTLLSKHPNTVVRCWAAWSEKLPATELPRLAKDRDVNVRHGVPEHKEAPAELMFLMGSRTTEPDRYIRQRARDHKNYPKKSERVNMANDKKTSHATLRVLVGDAVPQVAATARRRLEELGLDVPVFDDED